ncbi:hypothetical protein NMG60_11036158 [Bertholletia excelsa]
MWASFPNATPSLGWKKNHDEFIQVCSEYSDDETSSNVNAEDGLECPICWESFNIVENIPYVLWCGHTLCKNCILSLSRALLRFTGIQIHIPFFIFCPWCHLLTPRLVYKGQLKFPSKNFFLLWMIESLNENRVKSLDSVFSPRSPSTLGNQAINNSLIWA